ncbi:outer membrane beta-barrel protein [Microbulbifer salipaludis]|uniref:Outer membrane beta-barrel protein n=1 Tax=Microbulbifer salipaludis TaxID=187980 RepID=A0ABS3E4Y4_9GAMM|nr:outer membrane beta-barrel protein [Microbulbifer salipaludis]MBN8430370.1 outer membrane beta-barrel protein [Microbulbifer salipaludis]
MARLPLLLVVPLSLLGSSLASADFYSHRYGGISLQHTAQDPLCHNARAFVDGLNGEQQTAQLANCTDSGPGAKLYAGWRWSPSFAVEADLRQAATTTAQFSISNPQLPYLNIKETLTTRMGNAFVVGHLPVGRSGVSVFGKVGGGFWLGQLRSRQRGDALAVFQLEDGSLQPVLFPVDGTFSESTSGFHWGYGAGVSYSFRNRWSLRAEWEWFPEIGSDALLGKHDVESASLGWSVHF